MSSMPTWTLNHAVMFSAFVAVSFVGSMYVIIPPKVRQLERDHSVHVSSSIQSGHYCESIAYLDIVEICGYFGVRLHKLLLLHKAHRILSSTQ